jgi:T5SS/PEP-CTERM-associated repeat protein
MSRINRCLLRHSSPQSRIHRRMSPLRAAVLAAIGLSAASTSSVYAQAHEYIVDEVITEDRDHAAGFNVGTDSPVVVDVTGAANLTSDRDVRLGGTKEGSGTVRLDGGSSLTLARNRELYVGWSGVGHLGIHGGSKVSSSYLTLGDETRGRGTVVVSGAGSVLEAGSVKVGAEGHGLLRIENGGVVNVQGALNSHHYSTFELQSDPSGRLEISGAGSLLKVGKLSVGTDLLVEQGGHIESNEASIKTVSLNSGVAVITGEGSRWQNAGVLEVEAGFDVRDRAVVSTDTLTVDGRGSINNPETDLKYAQLRVADSGSLVRVANGVSIDGILTLSNGGRLEAGGDISLGLLGSLVFGGHQTAGGIGQYPSWSAPEAAGTIDDSVITFGVGYGTVAFNHNGYFELSNTIRSEMYDRVGIFGQLTNVAGSTNLTGDLTGFGGLVRVQGGRLQINSDLFVTESDRVDVGGDGWQHTVVDGGTFILNGTSGFLHSFGEGDEARTLRTSAVEVNEGGTFGGNATVGRIRVNRGGILSPGADGIGTLNVDGDLHFNTVGYTPPGPAAVYDVDVLGNGESDRIKVAGTAYIGLMDVNSRHKQPTAVRITGLDPATSYQNGQRYTILEADAGVTGAFDEVLSNSAFLTGTLTHTANTVELDVAVNAVNAVDDGAPSDPDTAPIVFGQVAATANQRSVAAGLDSLHQSGDALALYNQLLMLDADTARAAFDELGGEVHASQRALLLDDRFLRDGISQRLRPNPARAEDGGAVWVAGSADGRTQRGDGSAANVRDQRQGLLIGTDWTLGERWTFGMAGGSEQLRQQIRVRNATSEVDALHAGLYAGFRSGQIWFKGGAAYADYQIETERSVGAGQAFEQHLRSRQDARAWSAFTEGGWDLELDALTLTPYVAMSYTRLISDATEEVGGNAALAIAASRDEVWTSTAGVRASWDISGGQRDRARLEGGLAWEHRAGDLRADSQHQFMVGSDTFTVEGLPLARNVGVAEFGVALSPTDNSRLSLFAQARRGSGERGFGAQANWTIAF